MDIRMLTEGDVDAFWSLRLHGLQESPTAFGSDYETSSQRSMEQVRAQFRSDVDHCVFGAFDGDTLVGLAGFMRVTSTKERHKAEIWGMYVHEAYRGHGVAGRLLDSVVDHGRAQPGLRQIQLAVVAGNEPAEALYQRAGFVAFGREPRALHVNGVDYDELHMVLQLRD